MEGDKRFIKRGAGPSIICSWALQDCHLEFLGDISGYFDRPLMLLDPLTLKRTVVFGLNSVWYSSATSPREKDTYSFHCQRCIKVDLWLRRSSLQSPLLKLKQVTHATVTLKESVKWSLNSKTLSGNFQGKYFNLLSIISVKICLSYKPTWTSVSRLKGYCFNWTVCAIQTFYLFYSHRQYPLKIRPSM